MPLLNYTTNIDADKTAGEVSKILARAKVSSTSTHYDQNGAPAGISFTLTTPHGTRDFQLPVNVDGVYQILKSDRSISPRLRERDQAVRVAWRIAKDWVEAQVALVAAGMVTIDEVMLPYLVVGDDRKTLYSAYQAREAAALEA
jgi:hypothetical protein